jgi:dTDP-4-dehydrorhamnose 3,5-epimerase
MNVIKTPFEGLLIIEPAVFGDDRGYFFESFNEKVFQEKTGFTNQFVQDNQARSTQNVLRGLHYQNEPIAQTKLIRCLQGSIWDVVVDLRKSSATYGKWYGVELSDENKRQFLIPKGFAHGYSVLSPTAEVFYKCDNFYSKAHEGGVKFNDPSLNIDWKINLNDAIISEKDALQPLFAECKSQF